MQQTAEEDRMRERERKGVREGYGGHAEAATSWQHQRERSKVPEIFERQLPC